MIYLVTAIGNDVNMDRICDIARHRFGDGSLLDRFTFAYALREPNGMHQHTLPLKCINLTDTLFPTRALIINGEWKEPFELPTEGISLEYLKKDLAWDHYFYTILRSLPGDTKIGTFRFHRTIISSDDMEQRYTNSSML